MGCRANEMSRNWDIAQLKCRATEMSRRWDVALEKSRANGISPIYLAARLTPQVKSRGVRKSRFFLVPQVFSQRGQARAARQKRV